MEEVAVDVDEAHPGAGALVADVAVLSSQEAVEPELELAPGREVGVAALGRERAMPLAVPVEPGLAEAGAGRDQRGSRPPRGRPR